MSQKKTERIKKVGFADNSLKKAFEELEKGKHEEKISHKDYERKFRYKRS